MSLMKVFPEILEAGKTEYEQMKAGDYCTVEACGDGKNLLALGDNGAFMKALLHDGGLAGKLQMVYIDPPFFSKANYDAVIRVERDAENGGSFSMKHRAYDDVWSQGLGEYLTMLASRLYLIRDLLREDGTVWVHLDWHAVHYVRILMDEIFGADHFINEIIWSYKSGGSGKKHFARKHDTILVYSKTKDYHFQPLKEKSYNRGFKPYHFKGVEEFQDDIGWYTMVNMKDVWQIDMVGRTSAERTGYATQKPEALLERIIQCSTREGDLCADFFCGSGTLAAAAQKLNRRWICCDQGKLAVSTAYGRVVEGACLSSCPEGNRDNISGIRLLAETGTGWAQSAGKLEAELSEDGEIHLTGCRISLDSAELETLDEESLHVLKETAENHPLQLLEYWTIDDTYDGQIHRPKYVLRRKKGRLETVWKLPEVNKNRKTEQTVSVAAVDVLGNRYQTVL